MSANRTGHFSVTCNKGIALVGFLARNTDGVVQATSNAPTWLSAEEKISILCAVEAGETVLSLGNVVYTIESCWDRQTNIKNKP